jgi:hypothetical protein
MKRTDQREKKASIPHAGALKHSFSFPCEEGLDRVNSDLVAQVLEEEVSGITNAAEHVTTSSQVKVNSQLGHSTRDFMVTH